MERLSDYTQRLERAQRANALVSAAIACDTRLSVDLAETLRVRGAHRYIKDAGALLSSDANVALHGATTAFLAETNAQSLVGTVPGLVTTPLMDAARMQMGTIAAQLVAEGDELPVATIAFDLSGAANKVATGGVFSREVLMSLDPGTQDTVTATLTAATAAATDVQIIAALTSGSPASSADPGVLLAAISNGRPTRPVLIGGFDALLALDPGRVRDLQALGVAVIPCAAAAGFLAAVDSPGLLFADGGIVVQMARDASVPLSIGGSPAVLASLWQANLLAVRVVRLFKIALRANAVSFAAVGSPA